MHGGPWIEWQIGSPLNQIFGADLLGDLARLSPGLAAAVTSGQAGGPGGSLRMTGSFGESNLNTGRYGPGAGLNNSMMTSGSGAVATMSTGPGGERVIFVSDPRALGLDTGPMERGALGGRGLVAMTVSSGGAGRNSKSSLSPIRATSLSGGGGSGSF